jgi:hypothetical protein
MSPTGDRGPFLAYTHPLPRGPRVHLRLARARDSEGIAALLRDAGHKAEQLDVARLVRFDPRARCVICATGLADGRERVVGVGAIALGGREPELLVVDETLTEGLRELLRWALLSRAQRSSGARAA